jgi:hypothetical protein
LENWAWFDLNVSVPTFDTLGFDEGGYSGDSSDGGIGDGSAVAAGRAVVRIPIMPGSASMVHVQTSHLSELEWTELWSSHSTYNGRSASDAGTNSNASVLELVGITDIRKVVSAAGQEELVLIVPAQGGTFRFSSTWQD